MQIVYMEEGLEKSFFDMTREVIDEGKTGKKI
jgi:hypothetical protein